MNSGWLKRALNKSRTSSTPLSPPDWVRLWKTPTWTSSLGRQFPWTTVEELLSDISSWLGPDWKCSDIKPDKNIPPGVYAKFHYPSKTIYLCPRFWEDLQNAFQGKLPGPERWRLLHILIHEAIHGYSPVLQEISKNGRYIERLAADSMRIFEEGLTEVLTQELLRRWEKALHANARFSLAASEELNMYPVEVGLILDLTGSCRPNNKTLRSFWELPETHARNKEADRLTLKRLIAVLRRARYSEDTIQALISRNDGFHWHKLYPWLGPMPAKINLGRILPSLTEEADKIATAGPVERLEWLKKRVGLMLPEHFTEILAHKSIRTRP